MIRLWPPGEFWARTPKRPASRLVVTSARRVNWAAATNNAQGVGVGRFPMSDGDTRGPSRDSRLLGSLMGRSDRVDSQQ